MSKSYILAVILTALCGITAQAIVFPEPDFNSVQPRYPYEPLEEAQMLAIEAGGGLQPDEELTQQILNDLAIIRTAYPDMADIHYRMPYAPKEMLVGLTGEAVEQFKAGQYHGLDELNEQYGVAAIDANHIYHGSDFIKLTFGEVYNMEALSDIYEQAHPEGLVYAQPNHTTGDGSTISAEPPEYTFKERWGDCPAGCIEGRNWNFKVENGQAILVSVNGKRGMELWVPAQYETIQSAIDAALDGDTVIVEPGIYYENIDLKGKAIIVKSSAGALETEINGNGEGPVVQCVSGEGPDTAIDGFTITGGTAEFGGGLYIEDSAPTIVNCIFKGNSAENNGGAIYNKDGGLTAVNCIFSENSAINGGGIYNDGGEVTICNCTFSQNRATGNGRGLCTSGGGKTNVKNSIFWDFDNVAGTILNERGIQTAGERVVVIDYRPVSPIYTYQGSSTDVRFSCVENLFTTFGNGNIFNDPLFVNSLAGNFRLKPNSPCINKGSEDAIPADEADLDEDGDTVEPMPLDIYGKGRIWGETVDMGAIEYRPNYAPVANAGPDRTIEATERRTKVILDGTASTDIDSTTGTNNDIIGYEWYIRSEPPIIQSDAEEKLIPPGSYNPCDPNYGYLLRCGKVIICHLPLGVHTITLKVTDKAGRSDTDTVVITIRDTTPPVIKLKGKETITVKVKSRLRKDPGATAYDLHDGAVPVTVGGDEVQTSKTGTYVITYDAVDSSGNAAQQVTRTVIVKDTRKPHFRLWVRPRVLKPMNNQMVRIVPQWRVRDNADPLPDVTLVSIVAVERRKIIADMNDSSDITVADDGAIYLRAARTDVRFRRTYIITYQATDESGNFRIRRAKVHVSRRQVKQIQGSSFSGDLSVPETPSGFVLQNPGG